MWSFVGFLKTNVLVGEKLKVNLKLMLLKP